MPLKKGSSKKVIKENTEKMYNELEKKETGKSPKELSKQAFAIANTKAKKKKK